MSKMEYMPVDCLQVPKMPVSYTHLKDCDDAILEFIDTTREEGIPVDGFQLSSGYCAVETEQGLSLIHI